MLLAALAGVAAGPSAAQPDVADVEKQKQAADKDIRTTQAELNANERQVGAGLTALRRIDDEIAGIEREIATVENQINLINGNISQLEGSIAVEEGDLQFLRDEYLKAVKKMRVAGKKCNGLAFIFASASFNEAQRRMRYMRQFSDWKTRRQNEILGKVELLQTQRGQLAQARQDATVALHRQQSVQARLRQQRTAQETAVNELRANSDALRGRLARRQAEARQLSNQISTLIAQQRARDEAAQRAAAERTTQERAAAEAAARAQAEAEAQVQAQAQAQANAQAQAQPQAQPKKKQQHTASLPQPTPQPQPAPQTTASTNTKKKGNQSTPASTDYAEARKRKSRRPGSETQSQPAATAPAAPGFEGMKGQLPRPVGGSFKIVSAFGVHPISPELPDIMDENLGIDAQVANGASACAVYDGEVLKVYDRTNTPGFRNIIVLKHGDYITVYANLETLAVKTGQKVKQGQSIGTVGADFDDPSHGMIHFEVWKNQTHLDPAAWIKR